MATKGCPSMLENFWGRFSTFNFLCKQRSCLFTWFWCKGCWSILCYLVLFLFFLKSSQNLSRHAMKFKNEHLQICTSEFGSLLHCCTLHSDFVTSPPAFTHLLRGVQLLFQCNDLSKETTSKSNGRISTVSRPAWHAWHIGGQSTMVFVFFFMSS